MELHQVIEFYKNGRQSSELYSMLFNQQKKTVYLSGLTGSAGALFIAGYYNQFTGPLLVLLGDREEAAYFQNDLENLLGENRVLLFPSSYKKPYKVDQLDSSLVLQRAEVLTRINKSDNLIIVSYPEAIQEKVITKKSLERNTLEIKINERLSTDFIQEFLLENKFERTDFVYEPGQFAIRGGIVDIYSFAHELPYRIEFYNDKIESIRCFDPSTQLSEKNIGFVTIIPNIQTGIVKEEQESFFNFISKNTLFFIKDLEYVYQCIEASQEVTEQNYGSNIFYEAEQVERNIDEIFDSIDDFKTSLALRTLIEFGSKPYNNDAPVIEFKTKPQPHFNKNFNLLLENLYLSQKKNFINLLFSDSAKQAERLHSIFEDIPRPDEFKGKELKFQIGRAHV